MDYEPQWVHSLRTELEDLDPADRVRASGDWIVWVTHVLLPELGKYRRDQINQILAQSDWDSQRLAETIGSRTSTIDRLAREGRKQYGLRQEPRAG